MKVISRCGRQFFGDRWKSQDNAQVLVVKEDAPMHTQTLSSTSSTTLKKKILRGIHRCFANNHLSLDVMLDITVALIFLCNMSSVSQLLSSTFTFFAQVLCCLWSHSWWFWVRPLFNPCSLVNHRKPRCVPTVWYLHRSPTPSPPFYLYTNWGMLILEMHGCFQLIDIISETVDPRCRTTWWMGRWKGRMQVRAYPCCLACGFVSGHGWCHYPVFTNS